MKYFLVACAALLIAAPAAHGATIVYPQNGATVPSRPVFVPDFATGKVEVEWSRSADTRTDTGAFVAPELAGVFAWRTTRRSRPPICSRARRSRRAAGSGTRNCVTTTATPSAGPRRHGLA